MFHSFQNGELKHEVWIEACSKLNVALFILLEKSTWLLYFSKLYILQSFDGSAEEEKLTDAYRQVRIHQYGEI